MHEQARQRAEGDNTHNQWLFVVSSKRRDEPKAAQMYPMERPPPEPRSKRGERKAPREQEDAAVVTKKQAKCAVEAAEEVLLKASERSVTNSRRKHSELYHVCFAKLKMGISRHITSTLLIQ